MNVSTILGVLRNELSRSPTKILKNLNDSLWRREHSISPPRAGV